MRNAPRTPSFGVCRRLFRALLATVLIATVSARGGEEDLYANLLRRYDNANAELRDLIRKMDQSHARPDYPRDVVSIRRNASVTIGGELRVNYIGSRATVLSPDPGDQLTGRRLTGRSKTASLEVSTANIDVEFRAGKRWRAYFDINLNGYHGFNRIARLTNPNPPGTDNPTTVYDKHYPVDNIDAAYVELLKAGHSGFGGRVGIMDLPFGLSERPNLVGQSFMDAPDLNGSYLVNPQSWDNGVRLPHASRFLDPVMAALLTYEMRDIVRFEAAIFQERNRYHDYHYDDGGVRKYRSDSDAPQSWQVGLRLLPLEGWELAMHFRNRHSRSRGVRHWADSPYRWDFRQNLATGRRDPRWDSGLGQWTDTGSGESFGGRRNEQAFIIGLALEIPNTDWSLHGEYACGWNQGFNKHLNSEGVNIGLAWRATTLLTLHLQGEWLQVKDRSWMAETSAGWVRDNRNHRLYRFLLGAEYELHRALTLEAGWQYEYWKLTSSQGGEYGARDVRVNTANTMYMGTRLIF